MTKPSLIVGLGGTGIKVLSRLKKDLMLSNNGAMLNHVKLLGIDTSVQVGLNAEEINPEVTGERKQNAGNALTPEELVDIGDNKLPLKEEIRKNKSSPAEGFLAERLLKKTPSNKGAGSLRQLGRLAVFGGMLGQASKSKIWSIFESAIIVLREFVSEDKKLEIIIVGSLAGGTGSGMAIDVAVILRMIACQMGVHHVVRGLFKLPDLFPAASDSITQGHTFAALRELNRFMLLDKNPPMPVTQKLNGDEVKQNTPDQRLFDTCYLVDPMPSEKSFNTETKGESFSAMAEAIFGILSEETVSYTRNIPNPTDGFSRKPNAPLYSSIGTYKIQLPVYFFDLYEKTAEFYQKLLKDPKYNLDRSQLHIFPAELLAAKFEFEDSKRNGLHKTLHPQVVMLLENISSLEQFLYLFALGKVGIVEAEGIIHWELKLKDGLDGIWLTHEWSAAEEDLVHPRLSLFDAILGYAGLKEAQNCKVLFRVEETMMRQFIADAMNRKEESVNEIENEIMWIDRQMEDGGILDAISQQSPDPKDGHIRQEYIDLVRVAKLILLNRRKELLEMLG